MLAPSAVAYRLPAMSAGQAVLARCLSRRRALRGADGFGLTIVAQPACIDDPVAFDLTLGKTAARLILPRRLQDDLLRQLDPAALQAAPDAAAMLFELALEPLLLRLEAACPWLAVAVRPSTGQWTPSCGIGLVACLGSVTETLRLELDSDAADALVPALAAVPDAPAPLGDLPVLLHLRTHTADVTVAALAAAQPGDVVLVDALPDRGVLVVANEHFVWRASREGPSLRLMTSRQRPNAAGLERWVMGQAIEPDDAADLDELPVRLSFELGRLELTLAELAVLGPGHVFELARDETQPVDILANGRRIGRGRIVSVAGTIGVQIVHLGRE